MDRIERLDGGRVRLRLKRVFSDGTWAVEMDELSLVARLVALVPPAWQNQVRYSGVLAPASSFRKRVIPAPPEASRAASSQPEPQPSVVPPGLSEQTQRPSALWFKTRRASDGSSSTWGFPSTCPPPRPRAGHPTIARPSVAFDEATHRRLCLGGRRPTALAGGGVRPAGAPRALDPRSGERETRSSTCFGPPSPQALHPGRSYGLPGRPSSRHFAGPPAPPPPI